LVVMVGTGTRSLVLGFMIGSSAYLFPYWQSKRTWIAIISVILSVVVVLYMIAGNPEVSERWLKTYYEGDTSGRDEVYAITGDMTGNLVGQKVLWLFLALTLAAVPIKPRKLGKQFPALLRIKLGSDRKAASR